MSHPSPLVFELCTAIDRFYEREPDLSVSDVLAALDEVSMALACKRARTQYHAYQAARDAQKDLSAHFRDACLPPGYSTTGRELRSEIQIGSAPRSSVAAVPEQVCGAWWMAGPLIFTWPSKSNCHANRGHSAVCAN